MNLKELTWPLRVYWDLPAGPSDPAINSKETCEEIIKIKVLFLSLKDSASTVSRSCLDVLERLKGENIGVSLTVSDPALTPSLLNALTAPAVRGLFVEASSTDEVRSVVEKMRQYEKFPGISFSIGRDNYTEIPEVISICLDNGIYDLLFPIQRLKAGSGFFYSNKKEREELSLKLNKIDYRKIRLTIHDPFLWEIFYPDADYHEGGCQAANSMLYISPEYKVYPCPAMPVEIGDLHKSTLREIILSEGKKELRRAILLPPSECAGCDRADKCLGGCRGRALAAFGSLDRLDPACR